MPQESTKLKSNKDEDILREVPVEEWPLLRDLYQKEWPQGIYTYYFLQNCIRWKRAERDFSVKVYSPNGDWSCGTFVADSLVGGAPHVNMDTLEPDCKRLAEVLMSTRLIDWSKGHLFCGIHERQRHIVKNLITEYSLPIKYDLLSGYHWLSKEKCQQLELRCPAEVYVAKLSEDQATLLNSLWPHKFPGSEAFLRQLIRLNGGMGVFLKSDNSICSWILRNQFSGLGILHTLEEHRNKGYAKLVTKALSKEMAGDGIDLHTCIIRSNHISQNLFRNIGFNHVSDIFWMQLDISSPDKEKKS